jgi:hypothetical protein
MSTQLVEKARALLESSQYDSALQLLSPELGKNSDNVEFLQIFGECLLENNDLDNAYDVLVKACQLDPHGDKGTEKFLYLGQMIGGVDGLNSLEIGLAKLNHQLNLLTQNQINDDPLLSQLSKLYTTNETLKAYLVKKLNQGIFAQIEIWMTDMCMEPEAEAKCNELIEFSLGLDKENPETFSLLASIRISQQRNDEAKESLVQSWTLFQQKKAQLEQAANSIRNTENNDNNNNNDNDNNDAFEVGVEYVELIQPLLTLSKFAIELEQYEIGATITSNIQDINENILDTYYYEALAYLFAAKQLYHQTQNPNPKNEDYRDVDNKELLKCCDVEVANKVKEAKSSLTNGYKIINSDGVETADPELVEQVNALLIELGGPVMSELMPARNEDETGWEDEIQSDNE